jgi:hypothetical protein
MNVKPVDMMVYMGTTTENALLETLTYANFQVLPAVLTSNFITSIKI